MIFKDENLGFVRDGSVSKMLGDLNCIPRMHVRSPGLMFLFPVLWRWRQADTWSIMAKHPSIVTESLMPVKDLVSSSNNEKVDSTWRGIIPIVVPIHHIHLHIRTHRPVLIHNMMKTNPSLCS